MGRQEHSAAACLGRPRLGQWPWPKSTSFWAQKLDLMVPPACSVGCTRKITTETSRHQAFQLRGVSAERSCLVSSISSTTDDFLVLLNWHHNSCCNHPKIGHLRPLWTAWVAVDATYSFSADSAQGPFDSCTGRGGSVVILQVLFQILLFTFQSSLLNPKAEQLTLHNQFLKMPFSHQGNEGACPLSGWGRG